MSKKKKEELIWFFPFITDGGANIKEIEFIEEHFGTLFRIGHKQKKLKATFLKELLKHFPDGETIAEKLSQNSCMVSWFIFSSPFMKEGGIGNRVKPFSTKIQTTLFEGIKLFFPQEKGIYAPTTTESLVHMNKMLLEYGYFQELNMLMEKIK